MRPAISTLRGGEIFGESCVPGIGGALPVLGTLLGRLSLETRLTTLPLLKFIGKFELDLPLMYLKGSTELIGYT